MGMVSVLRWMAFAAYVSLFFCVPFTILWGVPGFCVGAGGAALFLGYLRFQGNERIAAQIGLRRLSPAEAPYLKSMVHEFSRRLKIVEPRLGVIDNRAVNIAVFGFSRREAYLALTVGALENLSRSQIAALVGRQLCHLRSGSVSSEPWLCRFLGTLSSRTRRSAARKHQRNFFRSYPIRFFLKEILLYPLTLYPTFVLRDSKSASKLDLHSIRLSRNPRALSEALRRMEAMVERQTFLVPFPARHLFLLPPASPESLTRVFFGREDLSKRIDAIEKLAQVVPLT